MFEITVNGKVHQFEADADTPLLWVLREQLGMTGTKFGCGIGMCGACTVHVNGVAMRTCILPIAAVGTQEITTIEGLDHPVQAAWVEEQVPQCGYCQSGQLMAAAGFLESNRNPTDDDIHTGITNLCRCGTYDRIRKAIHRDAAALPPLPPPPEPVVEAVGPDGLPVGPAGAPAQSTPVEGAPVEGAPAESVPAESVPVEAPPVGATPVEGASPSRITPTGQEG